MQSEYKGTSTKGIRLENERNTKMNAQNDDGSDDEWEPVESALGAAKILQETIFEFAAVIKNLCIQEEELHPKKYLDKTKPSTKIAVVTVLMRIWDNNPGRLAEHYVNYVLNWEQYIKDRNDRFFLENDHIYPRAPKEDIEFFRDLWRPNSTFHLSKDEKESVYEYFDTMIHYCKQWKKHSNYIAGWEKESDPVEVSKGKLISK